MPCVGCGATTVPGAAFCGACGAAVDESDCGEPEADRQVDAAKGRGAEAVRSTPVRYTAARSAAVGPDDGRPAGPATQPSEVAPHRAADGDLTRYLCAAAYLDREYAKLLVKQIAAEPHLAVAAAPACDVPVVLRHAYAANARRHQRDLLLAVLLLLVFVFTVSASGPLLTLLTLLLAWGTVLAFELSTMFGSHLQDLRPESFDPEAAPTAPHQDAEARLQQVGAYATGNVTVYSGYSPFVGYGVELDSWSFALDVTKPGGSGDIPRDFDVTDLYAHVADRLGPLVLPDLRIEERLFVDGSDIVGDQRFLPDSLGRPVAEVSQEQLDALKRAPEDRARPYLAVHSTGWGGELVTSLFVRFYRSESNLSVEAVHTVLCPLLERYRIIDTLLPSPSVGDFAKKTSETMVSTFFMLLASPARAVMGFAPDFGMTRRVRRQNRMITRLHRFDYGARLSVRQQASDTNYHRYFQKLDTKMALKVAERRVLDALVEFAEKNGIDVGDLVQRQETIINNGIIATSGATVESSSVASGKKASISIDIPLKLPRLKLD
ncbi:zinc ribbon domain-containing protein [Kitasatospora sp. NPDC056138]|uniref:zinc ribbon domain-containing protein n=1 Tax=Kitasatospora sp. NPDC056138 TaxID=3345724 RepID=UPI0035D9608F